MMWCNPVVILHRNSKTNDMEEDEITMFTFDLPMYMHPFKISGLRTGYYELNSILSGWQKGKYVIVGYSNANDAKEFIENNAIAANRLDNKIAVISPNKATVYPMISSKGTIVFDVNNSIHELKKKIRCLVRFENVKALFINDFKMLDIEGAKHDSHENIDYQISRDISQLCREINIPVILLVPIMSRQYIPRLSDLNTPYEQDADVVIFLMRDEKSKLNPIVVKNRRGSVSELSNQ